MSRQIVSLRHIFFVTYRYFEVLQLAIPFGVGHVRAAPRILVDIRADRLRNIMNWTLFLLKNIQKIIDAQGNANKFSG